MFNNIIKAFARVYRTPQYLILFVSNTCWTHCKHCWVGEAKKNNIGNNRVLSFDELEKLSFSIKKVAFLSLTGGEAFKRDDIVEIVKMFNKNSNVKRFQIPTSGFGTDMIIKKTENILMNSPSIPFRVDVSLDGNEEIHDQIRGVNGAYKNALNTIIELNILCKKYKNLDVGIITTISAYNQNIVDEISEIVRHINPHREWMINLIRGEVRDSYSKNVNLSAYYRAHEIIDNWKKSDKDFGHNGHFTAKWLSAKNVVRRNVIGQIVDGKNYSGNCSAGILAGVIYCDGSVYPCELLHKSMGNIREYDYNLELLWNSQKADEISKHIKDIKCSCTQECFWSMNLLMQPRWWPKIIWERLKAGL
jgi:radical SAM protein with 4Fe4S-binding SPASM domain